MSDVAQPFGSPNPHILKGLAKAHSSPPKRIPLFADFAFLRLAEMLEILFEPRLNFLQNGSGLSRIH